MLRGDRNGIGSVEYSFVETSSDVLEITRKASLLMVITAGKPKVGVMVGRSQVAWIGRGI